MTTLELIAFLEFLRKNECLSEDIHDVDFEFVALAFQKQANQPDWKEKFFNQNPKQ